MRPYCKFKQVCYMIFSESELPTFIALFLTEIHITPRAQSAICSSLHDIGDNVFYQFFFFILATHILTVVVFI